MPLAYTYEGGSLPVFQNEFALVCHVNGTAPGEVPDHMWDWVGLHTTIASQFSRPHPTEDRLQMISPSRAASIPLITARWQELIRPARGDLDGGDILHAWRTNMPENNERRHPDALFDITQMNFGTDEPVGHIVDSVTWAQRERLAMSRAYRSALRQMLAPLRFRGDVSEEWVDALIDRLHG